MKASIFEILKRDPCTAGLVRALRACDADYYVDLTHRLIRDSDREWTADFEIPTVDEPAGAPMLDARGLHPNAQRRFACIDIWRSSRTRQRPLTGTRLDKALEDAVVRMYKRVTLKNRPSAAEYELADAKAVEAARGDENWSWLLGTMSAGWHGYHHEPWYTTDEDRAYVVNNADRPDGGGIRLSLEFYTSYLDDALGKCVVVAVGPNKFLCRDLGLSSATWREVVAAYMARMWTVDEAITELDRTRPAGLR
jgi:hypothetical protein